jgi:hypothetical protein
MYRTDASFLVGRSQMLSECRDFSCNQYCSSLSFKLNLWPHIFRDVPMFYALTHPTLMRLTSPINKKQDSYRQSSVIVFFTLLDAHDSFSPQIMQELSYPRRVLLVADAQNRYFRIAEIRGLPRDPAVRNDIPPRRIRIPLSKLIHFPHLWGIKPITQTSDLWATNHTKSP